MKNIDGYDIEVIKLNGEVLIDSYGFAKYLRMTPQQVHHRVMKMEEKYEDEETTIAVSKTEMQKAGFSRLMATKKFLTIKGTIRLIHMFAPAGVLEELLYWVYRVGVVMNSRTVNSVALDPEVEEAVQNLSRALVNEKIKRIKSTGEYLTTLADSLLKEGEK